MIYFIFISLVVGIITFKIARKMEWEERLTRKRKERKVAWDKTHKGVQYGKGVRKHNKHTKRKR